MDNIKKLENDLWESADLLRSGSKLTSNEYCMPVLGLIFLRYAYSRYKMVEAAILKDRPMRNGKVVPVEASDFNEKSALYLPRQAQYEWLINLPNDIKSQNIKDTQNHVMTSLGEVVNNAMSLVEQQSEQLSGILPKEYTDFSDELLSELIRIFNNKALDDVGGDVIGRIYEYFLNKFAKNIASDDGVFFTPKSLVKMIVNVLEPKSGTLLDPACGSGGMFVQTGDFVNGQGFVANNSMTFYGQEKVEYNAKLCLMNMAVHGLTGVIKSGDEANTFYHDAHNLDGKCDYVMANPPFNVDKVKEESCQSAGRLPFGMPGVNKSKEISNANYLWISYFYSYLNENGRAGFVMASSATDSQGKDKEIRTKLIQTGHVDVMLSVGNNFFYTKPLPCTEWFFDKGKPAKLKNKVLFIDARNYYTVAERTLNEWSEWQLKNLNAIVWLYRGETDKYNRLLQEYRACIDGNIVILKNRLKDLESIIPSDMMHHIYADMPTVQYLDINNLKESLQNEVKALQSAFKITIKDATKKNIKLEASLVDDIIDNFQAEIDVIKEYIWLYEKFGDGKYQDIAGLCKIEDTSVILDEKGSSLTPGAYVGVAPVEDDGIDFEERMFEIHKELLSLQKESNDLMNTISQKMKEMGV